MGPSIAGRWRVWDAWPHANHLRPGGRAPLLTTWQIEHHRTLARLGCLAPCQSSAPLGTCSPSDSMADRASPDAGASRMLGPMPIGLRLWGRAPLLTAWQIEHRRTLARLGCLAPCQSSAPWGTCSPSDNVAARASPDAGASRRTMAPCQSACAFGLASWGSIVKKRTSAGAFTPAEVNLYGFYDLGIHKRIGS